MNRNETPSRKSSRAARAVALIQAGAVRLPAGEHVREALAAGQEAALVRSQSGSGWYLVTAGTCTCPDYTRRNRPCKHLLAVQQALGRRDEDRPRQSPIRTVKSWEWEDLAAGNFTPREEQTEPEIDWDEPVPPYPRKHLLAGPGAVEEGTEPTTFSGRLLAEFWEDDDAHDQGLPWRAGL